MNDNTLTVFIESRVVGTIIADREGRMSFQYSSSWIKNPQSYHISFSMPLRPEIYHPGIAHSFFANLLPEGPVRVQVTRNFGISLNNDFGLLERIGEECAGALWIGKGSPKPDRDQEYRLISEENLKKHISQADVYASFVGKGEARLSLAGAQDKLPVCFKEGVAALPLEGTPSTHILKFPNPGFKHLPDNEVYMTNLARKAGLNTINIQLHNVIDESTCLVKRYDRIERENGTVQRLHQEDFCQALGLPSAMKYEVEGGPSFDDCYKLTKEVSNEPLLDSYQLLKWLVFNLLTGNADAHAKNLSLLYHSNGLIRLAPFYDLISTLCYENISTSMAMRIGTKAEPDQVGPLEIEMLAENCEVNSEWLQTNVVEMAEKILQENNQELSHQKSNAIIHPRILILVNRRVQEVLGRFQKRTRLR